MHPEEIAPTPAPAPASLPSDWQLLPLRGAKLAALGSATGMAIPFALAFAALSRIRVLEFGNLFVMALIGALLGLGIGAWLGFMRHRRVSWKLDVEGFAVRRGNWWRTETRVPVSRVQHLDLKRGPLERGLSLATLVVHTAGTSMAAVTVSGLDGADAERLRDRLAHQLEQADDAL